MVGSANRYHRCCIATRPPACCVPGPCVRGPLLPGYQHDPTSVYLSQAAVTKHPSYQHTVAHYAVRHSTTPALSDYMCRCAVPSRAVPLLSG